MKKYEIESCYNLFNFLESGNNVTDDDINISIDICKYYKKMINDMHNGIIKDKLEIVEFYNFLEGSEDLVYNLDYKVTEIICQRLFDVFCFYQLFESGNINNINDAYDSLPFRDANINIEKNIFCKLFNDDSINKSYQALIDALIFHIYNKKLYDMSMNVILTMDKFIVENKIDYNFFEDNNVKKMK